MKSGCRGRRRAEPQTLKAFSFVLNWFSPFSACDWLAEQCATMKLFSSPSSRLNWMNGNLCKFIFPFFSLLRDVKKRYLMPFCAEAERLSFSWMIIAAYFLIVPAVLLPLSSGPSDKLVPTNWCFTYGRPRRKFLAVHRKYNCFGEVFRDQIAVGAALGKGRFEVRNNNYFSLLNTSQIDGAKSWRQFGRNA